MIRKYLKNIFYFSISGGVALAILKDEKIMNYSAELIENFSSKYIKNPQNFRTIEEEESHLKLLVIK